ncbi:MAG TPA: hypothetical protein ENJ00_09405 [Phycisphaerales bacterium]|nr:hypothetical protein [Phycisphaerales bacterium]
MDHFRLRGTWEEDPAPIPFPRHIAGRDAGNAASTQTKPDIGVEHTIADVEQELDRLQLRFDEFKDLFDATLDGFDDGDHPSAA